MKPGFPGFSKIRKIHIDTTRAGRRAGLFAVLALSLCVSESARADSPSAPNVQSAQGAQQIRAVIEALNRSPTGRKLVSQATKAWGATDLAEFVRWGEVSRTDAILTRYLNPRTGEERRERKVTIYLRRGESRDDRIMDLAHELVHATARPDWDPYDPGLSASGYITAAIEGPGGEVDAVISECQVGLELGISQSSSAIRCQAYVAEKGDSGQFELRRERVAADFYRAGHWATSLKQRLSDRAANLPLLSADSPVLFSSTGKLPYPMALFHEFEALNEVACRNSMGRLQSSSAPVRSRASEFMVQRCQKAR